MRTVPPGEWRDALGDLRDDGFAYLDYLAAIDRLDAVEVVAHVVDPDTGAHELVTTVVPLPDARLDSVTAIFPGANWHEREAAEMLGVVFDGHPDPRPLLLRNTPSTPPLRRSTALLARVRTPWPGAAGGDPAVTGRGRRRQAPPGVLESWLDEDQP